MNIVVSGLPYSGVDALAKALGAKGANLFALRENLRAGGSDAGGTRIILVIRDPRDLVAIRDPAYSPQYAVGFDQSLVIAKNWISNTDPGLRDLAQAAMDVAAGCLVVKLEDLSSGHEGPKLQLQRFAGLPPGCELPSLEHGGIASWTDAQNAERVVRQFRLAPLLFDVLKAWEYETNDSWFERLSKAAPEGLMDRRGTIVGYFTGDNQYGAEARRMEASVRRVNLAMQLTEISNRGGWLHNVRFKVEFLSELRKTRRGPLLYVDVDAVIHRDPWPYLSGLDGDAAFCTFRDGKARSGTIYLADTPGAVCFLQDWRQRLDAKPDAWDQHPLDDICREHLAGRGGDYRLQFLPPSLCYVFDRPGLSAGPTIDPIIEHLQASREGKPGPLLERRRARVAELERALFGGS